MSNNSNTGFVTSAQKVIAALQQPEFASKTLVLGGKAIKAKDLIVILQAAITAINAGTAAKISYKATVVKQQAAKATAVAYMPEIKSYIGIMYGKTSEQYATFGFAAQQPVKATAAVKAAAVEKRNATRVARGTLGKRARKAIKGVVETPATAAPAPTGNGSSGSNGTSSH